MTTSQPLETISEEPTTPARVTADPPKTKPAKSPARVAAGKKLAEENRRAREALKKVEAEEAAAKAAEEAAAKAAAASDSESNTEEASGGSGLSLVALLGIGGLLVSAAGVYYQREAIMGKLKPAQPPAQPAQPAEPAPSRIPVKRSLRKME